MKALLDAALHSDMSSITLLLGSDSKTLPKHAHASPALNLLWWFVVDRLSISSANNMLPKA
jgi:hypothetical protein